MGTLWGCLQREISVCWLWLRDWLDPEDWNLASRPLTNLNPRLITPGLKWFLIASSRVLGLIVGVRGRTDRMRILQWNSRGITGKFHEFSNMIIEFDIVCLQETWLHGKSYFSFKDFYSFRNDRPDAFIGGGTAILCRPKLDPILINIDYHNNLGIEFTCISILKSKLSDQRILVVSVYKPPDVHINQAGWKEFIQCFMDASSGSVIFCGDFNSQHETWGSSKNNRDGISLLEAISEFDLVLLNNGDPTRVSENSHSRSCPDISFVSSSLCHDCLWSISEEPFGSDHFQIYIQFSSDYNSTNPNKRPRMSLIKINKDYFSELIDESMKDLTLSDISGAHAYDRWSSSVLDCALKAGASISDASGHIQYFDQKSKTYKSYKSKFKVKNCKPWWDSECEEAIARRKRSFQNCRAHFTRENMEIYRKSSDEIYDVVLIPKPNKVDFRPISLASNVLKIFEKLIKGRFEKYIELEMLLPNCQFGFRRGKSCDDCLALINLVIYKAFAQRNMTGALFLDIKAAYDNVNPCILFIQYADDIAILCSDEQLDNIISCLRLTFIRVEEWLNDLDLSVSLPKTQFIVFHRKRSLTLPEDLDLPGGSIPLSLYIKYLGLVLDGGLRWKEHITSLRTKTFTFVNILRWLAGRTWGISPILAINFINATIRAISYKVAVNIPKSSSNRVCWAFSGQKSLIRRISYKCDQFLVSRWPMIAPFRSHLYTWDIHPVFSFPQHIFAVDPSIDSSSGQFAKDNGNPNLAFTNLISLKRASPSEIDIFTDGSKSERNGVPIAGCSIRIPQQDITLRFKLNKFTSSFSAEALAIITALDLTLSKFWDYVNICTDSLSVLQTIANVKPFSNGKLSPLIPNIKTKLSLAASCGCSIRFSWCPAHRGILGNEQADSAAKEASINGTLLNNKVSHKDMSSHLLQAYIDIDAKFMDHIDNGSGRFYMDNLADLNLNLIFLSKFRISRSDFGIMARLLAG
ncbi:uncharacterized protein [Temnothorax nylanderi]|uniref:uncharacterized protein n=1 Tax=Temnothorax nylanderi TaxID=102681 RepID=UPI003A8471F3